MRWLYLLCPAAVAAGLDQIVKLRALDALSPFEAVPVTSFFNLVLVMNRGAAFGFLNDPGAAWATRLLLGATAIAVLAILWIAKTARPGARLLQAGLGMILGGALGNAIDRINYGAVVDFLDFHWAGNHWPAFNVADIAICLGATLTALCIFREPVK